MSSVLISSRLVLRPPRLSDAQPLYDAAVESMAEVGRWLPWCHAAYKIAETREYIERTRSNWTSGDACDFLIFDRAGERLLGGCGVNRIDRLNHVANLGYWVRTSAASQGIATEAARMAARTAFRELKLRRLEIIVAVGNAASQRVAEKLGAHREGVLRQRIHVRGIQHDATCYSLVPADVQLWGDAIA